ncbi:hypothetical protein DQ04_10361020 [Trypanosoma grayi]|uniref:hypothetical protein n=1 Tax=Trypanosoma grayi TaxID=71804 RepID=UPI0004F47B88|nr:hypothetical protein DQ04_10361020 [Trypanosoma grayi]KEG07269.1 hypothetical protein DQ04_10361020 [Trypanosoma grayi]
MRDLHRSASSGSWNATKLLSTCSSCARFRACKADFIPSSVASLKMLKCSSCAAVGRFDGSGLRQAETNSTMLGGPSNSGDRSGVSCRPIMYCVSPIGPLTPFMYEKGGLLVAISSAMQPSDQMSLGKL